MAPLTYHMMRGNSHHIQLLPSPDPPAKKQNKTKTDLTQGKDAPARKEMFWQRLWVKTLGGGGSGIQGLKMYLHAW